METVKRLFISLLVLLGYSAGAWAIEQDSDGYYLIGSVQDWKDFAELVNGGTTNINARMIADIDLGDDQTHIGSMTQDRTAYSGIFDGQGYTLTVAYVGSSKQIVAPFTQVIGATIKNLHVDGSIQSAFAFVGVVGYVRGGASSYISNIWMSANASCNSGEWHHTGSIVGSVAGGSAAYVTNCLFTGTLTSGSSYSSTFIGCNYGGGIASSTNCLSTGTLNISGSVSLGTSNNCYVKQFPRTIPEEMQVTDEQLADGTIATALGDAWVQDAVTGQPMLKIFTTMRQDEEGYYLIGSVQDWNDFAELVNSGTDPAANAKMIRDVEISTTIGIREDKPFSGTFDGNGHVLTANITSTATGINGNDVGVAPFHFIKNATIKNLKVDGIINSSSIHSSGLVGVAYGTNLVVGCVVSAKIKTSAQYVGGIIAHGYDSNTTVKDCLFNGIIEGGTRIGVIWGHNHGGTGNIINCLEIGSYTNSSYVNPIYRSEGGTINCSNNYYITGNDNKNNKATDDDISDGTTAAALQADREEEIWVQDPVLGIPMLKIFANTEEAPVTDLSAKETANCYIVQAAGNYKFRATVKGNGSADLGGISRYTDASTIASAELVWATFNTTVTPEADELIKDIRYSNGYVYFSTGDIYKEGNALVAIKDAGGNILWSWHLWFESDDLDALVQTYPGSGYLVMDRNLGALTNCYAADNALDFGFAYQNGRKDPFMMSATRTSYTALGVLGTYTSSAGSSSLASSIQRPTVVFGTDSWGGSPDYWSASEKTIFDPCPPGWQVGPSDLWRASGFNSSTFVVKENDWATYHGCVFNGEAWYPATGDRWGGSHNNTGSLIRVWARGAGNALASNNGSAPTLGDGSNPGHGYSIRPVRIADFIYTVPVSGLGTFSADVNIIVPVGLTAYYCTTLKTYEDGKQGIRVSKLNGGIIPANTGVLFEGPGGQSYPLIATNAEAAAPDGNSLVAVVESQHIAATDGDYTNFMMKGGKFVKILDEDESVKMPAHRAYLPLLTSEVANANVVGIIWDDDIVTGLDGVAADDKRLNNYGDGTIYNLQGQKVENPSRGIYIINGKKVVIK